MFSLLPKIVKKSEFVRLLVFFILFLITITSALAQPEDVIERDYFPGARAKNSAIAAARYAQEGYYYTKFTTYINALDSSRMFADTALFFVKRSLMLSDTALIYAPTINYPAIDFLNSGRDRTLESDRIIRDYYPMVDVKSHNVFGRDAALNLSNAVMDFYNASLLLRAEPDAGATEEDRYAVMPYAAEVTRLEIDETAFQMASNALEEEIGDLERLSLTLQSKINNATDQKSRFAHKQNLDKVDRLLTLSTSRLKDTSHRIQEIRQLLNQKHLDDVKYLEDPEHLSYFETAGTQKVIEMDKQVPDGLVYKIQLGYYPSDVDIENFHGLFPISGETVRKDLARYYAGLFYSFKEAAVGSDYIRNNVIANAFIVPFKNGEKISISTAVEMERQRGVK